MALRQLLDDPATWPTLLERARSLALQEAVAVADAGDARLTFRLGGSSYSLPAVAVREVQPLLSYTPLPAVPPFVVGLVNVRGRLLTAIDLRPLLGLGAGAPPPGAQLLILAVDDNEIGLVADSVVAVRRHEGVLAPAPSATSGRPISWVRGVDDELTIHLDPELLFADPALLVNAEQDSR